jgi:hypothetical protein
MAARKPRILQLSKIRMREGLHQRLVRDAEAYGRTLNAEIVDRLERSLTQDANAERDRVIIAMLVGGDHGSTTFLRQVVFELQKRHRWWESSAKSDELIAVLSALVKETERADLETVWDYEDRQ